MKNYVFIVFFVIALVAVSILYFYNSKPKSNYFTERSSLNSISNNNNTTLSNISNSSSSNSLKDTSTTETEISNFSTKIQNKKDTNRQGNITITCSALNGTIVKAR